LGRKIGNRLRNRAQDAYIALQVRLSTLLAARADLVLLTILTFTASTSSLGRFEFGLFQLQQHLPPSSPPGDLSYRTGPNTDAHDHVGALKDIGPAYRRRGTARQLSESPLAIFQSVKGFPSPAREFTGIQSIVGLVPGLCMYEGAFFLCFSFLSFPP
jgi:hypothetical protein